VTGRQASYRSLASLQRDNRACRTCAEAGHPIGPGEGDPGAHDAALAEAGDEGAAGAQAGAALEAGHQLDQGQAAGLGLGVANVLGDRDLALASESGFHLIRPSGITSFSIVIPAWKTGIQTQKQGPPGRQPLLLLGT